MRGGKNLTQIRYRAKSFAINTSKKVVIDHKLISNFLLSTYDLNMMIANIEPLSFKSFETKYNKSINTSRKINLSSVLTYSVINLQMIWPIICPEISKNLPELCTVNFSEDVIPIFL